MSAPALAALPGGQPVERSWEEMLLEAIEPEFRVDVYHAVPGDPVLHDPTCAVGGCPGRGVNRSLGLNAGGENRSTGTRFRGYLCLAHVEMWRRDGEPPINVWVRQSARALNSQAVPERCGAPRCTRSTASNGLCGAHRRRWTQAGRPDFAVFLAAAGAVLAGGDRCLIAGCVSWIRIRSRAFAGASASTTIRRAFKSHHPPVSPGIDSNETENPSDCAKTRIGASRCACESPVYGSYGGPSGACSRPSIGSTCARSNTNTVLNSIIVSPVSSPVIRLRSSIGSGAMIATARSPFWTAKPSRSHVLDPRDQRGVRRGRVEARARRRIGIRDAVAYSSDELERIEALASQPDHAAKLLEGLPPAYS